MKIGKYTVDISSRDKVFFSSSSITKGELIDYYAEISETMLPLVERHGVTMERYPDGIGEDGFYNKDTPDYFPDWITTVKIPKKEGGSILAPVIDKKAALVYLSNQGVITPHLYLSQISDNKKPAKMIFDLDPPEGTGDFELVRKGALDLRDSLDSNDMKSWVMTTGSMGYHVIVPLDMNTGFDQVRAFARKTAEELVDEKPDKYTLEGSKDKRRGRLFIDTLNNAYGSTTVAPYGVRARENAPVATPITWDELESGAEPRDWTIKNIFKRLAKVNDPFRDMNKHRYSVKSRM